MSFLDDVLGATFMACIVSAMFVISFLCDTSRRFTLRFRPQVLWVDLPSNPFLLYDLQGRWKGDEGCGKRFQFVGGYIDIAKHRHRYP